VKFLALDIGSKRIGIASCDRLEVAANPFSVIPADKDAPRKIAALAEEEGADGVVVGMPYSMDGKERDACEMARKFIEKLKPHLKIPVEIIDERLTTKIAEMVLIEAGMRREKRKEIRDAVSAALILKTFLDRRRAKGETP